MRDGNLVNVPHSVDDIRRYYTIYGPQVEVVRGKTTKQHAKSAERVDTGQCNGRHYKRFVQMSCTQQKRSS